MTVYIAGPITGIENYRNKFTEKEWELRGQGHTIFNPAWNPPGLSHEAYMPIGYAMMDACDTVYFLKGWQQSKGAVLEYNYAIAKGMKLMFEEGKNNG